MRSSAPTLSQKIKDEGLRTLVLRRAFWYSELVKDRFSRGVRPNILISAGRFVESRKNRVRLERMTFSTDLPSMDTWLKGEVFLGYYEAEQRTLVKRCLPTDLPVVEFGGGLGVVSCLANRRLINRQDHVVVEANPQVVPLLERNRNMNDCRFHVVNRALAYDSATVALHVARSFADSRVGGDSGTIVSVPATSLEAIADSFGFDQFALICDIEGAEASLVEREIDVLRQRVPFLLVEIHPHILGAAGEARVVQALESAGFVLQKECSINRAFTRDRFHAPAPAWRKMHAGATAISGAAVQTD